jgi:hypothetical protein
MEISLQKIKSLSKYVKVYKGKNLYSELRNFYLISLYSLVALKLLDGILSAVLLITLNRTYYIFQNQKSRL